MLIGTLIRTRIMHGFSVYEAHLDWVVTESREEKEERKRGNRLPACRLNFKETKKLIYTRGVA
jgi:hypothetical protein